MLSNPYRPSTSSTPGSTTLIDAKVSSVVITEAGDGWVLVWSDGTSEFCGTAGEALQAVRDRGTAQARLGVSTAQIITWEPTSKIGKRVVCALNARGV